MLKRAIVVGASSGMGAELVRLLAQQGHKVVAIARREQALTELAASLNGDGQRVWALAHDVRETESVVDAFQAAIDHLGGLDVLVYSAGVMPAVEAEEWPTEKDHLMMEVNVLGAMSWFNLASARMRIQGSGTLVGIGSVAGERGRRGQPGYCASKAALHSYMESLRNRLSQHGVRVLTVKPGPVRTPMTEGLEKLPMVISVDVAANQIMRAIVAGKSEVYVPGRWRWIMAVIRSIPSIVFRRLDI